MVLTRTTSIVEEASISIIEKQLHQERITWTNNNLSINPYDEDWSIKEGKGSLKSISWLRVHGFQCFFLMQVVGWQKLIRVPIETKVELMPNSTTKEDDDLIYNQLVDTSST